MERQSVSKDKDSGIVNDANLWASETMGNPKYPLELFLRVITVSLETCKIVKTLPVLGDLGATLRRAPRKTWCRQCCLGKLQGGNLLAQTFWRDIRRAPL